MTVHHVNQLIITATINHQPLDHQIPMKIDHKAKIRELIITNCHLSITTNQLVSFHFFFFFASNFQMCSNRRNRKRRSKRRKAAQQTMLNSMCNAGLAPLNDVTKGFDMLPNSSYVLNQNTAAENHASNLNNKKRKFSSQDVPGPSTYYAKGSPKQAPMSEFYHSLLESSYHDNFNRMYFQ